MHQDDNHRKVCDDEDGLARTREPVRTRNCSAKQVSNVHDICNLNWRVQTSPLQCAPHWDRGSRCFGVTLVVWIENAGQKCFKLGTALA
jgi:hypothetical protein